jgi:hypothetical protein
MNNTMHGYEKKNKKAKHINGITKTIYTIFDDTILIERKK